MRRLWIVVLLVAFGGASLAQSTPPKRRYFVPDRVEQSALRDIVRRYQEVSEDLQALVTKARRDRTGIAVADEFGWDRNTGQFYADSAEVVSDVAATISSDTAPGK